MSEWIAYQPTLISVSREVRAWRGRKFCFKSKSAPSAYWRKAGDLIEVSGEVKIASIR